MTLALETLNNPALVVSTGAAAVAILPAFEQACLSGRIPWSVLKTSNALLFLLNLFATSRLGRLDEESRKTPNPNVRPLIFPAGWAFAIWGLSLPNGAVTNPSVACIHGGASLSNSLDSGVSQKYMETAPTTFVAPLFLSLTAYALSRAHKAYSVSRPFGVASYILFGLPLSLHFGWMCAAVLVNWNSSVYSVLFRDPKQWKIKGQAFPVAALRWVGHGSALLASLLGIVCTFVRQAPVFGAVLSWSLLACADTMEKWLLDKKLSVQKCDISLQYRLCRVGAILTMVASVFTSGTVVANSLHAASP